MAGKEEVDCCKKTARGHFNKPLKMCDEDKQKFKQAKECHLCGRSYTETE